MHPYGCWCKRRWPFQCGGKGFGSFRASGNRHRARFQNHHTPLFSFMEIHGWSSLERATPLSIRTLTVALLNEALKVSSRRHWCFLLSQTLLNFGCPALLAAIMTPLPLRWLRFGYLEKCVHYDGPINRPRLAVKCIHKCGTCGNNHASI